ncbi:MAG TPA: TetR/AcrR family transcriptional regulator [Desulfotignum sp.]|nr:TetR/AcrR family transcriptional regulator [Desulfotignum sp.]
MDSSAKPGPPGKIKIMTAFSHLMETKDFQSITTAEIAGKAGVTEGLIYKYFTDKKDLLHQVLHQHFTAFQEGIEAGIATKETCIEKLAAIVSASLASYAENRVLARILLLEVRNSLSYFESGAYAMVRQYARTLLGIIRQGMETGELRPDIDPYLVQKVILGAIEHTCLKQVIFDRKIDVSTAAAGIVDIVFNGVTHHG